MLISKITTSSPKMDIQKQNILLRQNQQLYISYKKKERWGTWDEDIVVCLMVGSKFVVRKENANVKL